MNKNLETIIAVIIGILMFVSALKIWFRYRKIQKTSMIVKEED